MALKAIGFRATHEEAEAPDPSQCNGFAQTSSTTLEHHYMPGKSHLLSMAIVVWRSNEGSILGRSNSKV